MGFTALHGLAAKGMTREIQTIIDNDWVTVRSECRCCLCTRIFRPVRLIDRVILNIHQKPGEVDEWGSSALHYAAEVCINTCMHACMHACIRTYKQAHAPITHAHTYTHTHTAHCTHNCLIYDGQGGHEETLSLLLEMDDFDVGLQDRSGHTALFLAAQVYT